MIGGMFFFFVGLDILGLGKDDWLKIIREHFNAAIGLPITFLTALFVVLFLEGT
jgi:hypothetical protein